MSPRGTGQDVCEELKIRFKTRDNNSPVLVFRPGTTSLILSAMELGPRWQTLLRSSSMCVVV